MMKNRGRDRVPQVRDPFGDEVVFAFQMTTDDQRRQVFEDWTEGEKHKHVLFADLLGINADGLLIASLLDCEYDLIVDHNGPKGRTYESIKKMVLFPKPVDKSFKTVDKSPKTVDRSVEIFVDNIASFPQAPAIPAMF